MGGGATPDLRARPRPRGALTHSEPEGKATLTSRIDFLYTNIGRGHPHYLDGIIECLPVERLGQVTDVLAATSGPGRQAWRAINVVYHLSARTRITAAAYNRLRTGNDLNRSSLAMDLLGRSLQRRYFGTSRPLVVAHPTLVAILRDRPRLIYQHGEVVAPRESWVRGRHRILVPLARTADAFLGAGFDSQNLFVSGLCIEPALVAAASANFAARLARLAGSDPLCGAFFSSGAEPQAHVDKLAEAAWSAVTAGGRAVIVARSSGRLAARVCQRFRDAQPSLESAAAPAEIPVARPQALLCLYESRRQLNELTAHLFADFDYLVAPAHERVHWALGLGLPMWIVDPSVGPFTPLNRAFLLEVSVARVLGDRQEASRFGETLMRHRRSGELRAMAEAGWERYDLRGFANIAEWLQSQ